jgi:hypothetical protein
MSAGIEEQEDIETGPRQASLWARAWEWLARWMVVFPPDEILRDGLSRRLALRCCNWLWPLEATVRRLIIAAALALDPFEVARAVAARPKGAQAQFSTEQKSPATFRVIAIRGAGSPRQSPSAGNARRYTARHLPFPSDELLRLGAPMQPRRPELTASHANPLFRRGRVRPTDPDYIPKSEADYANRSESLFGAREERLSRPEREPDSVRHFRCRAQIEPDDSEWRRLEKEWERVLPAPNIATRISALARVFDSPEQHIHRLARRLAANPDLAGLLHSAPPPVLRKPKYDYFLPQVDEDLTMLAWAATQPPDTS